MILSESYKKRLKILSGVQSSQLSENYELMAQLHQKYPNLSDDELVAHLHKSDEILSAISEKVSDIKTAEQLIEIYSEIISVLQNRIQGLK